jgi:ribonucleoside-diphosphate reductase alpha chain
MDLWVREARLFKYGSGTGSNFSKLRAENEKLSGGGKVVGADELPQDRRPRRRRHQVGRHHAPRRQDGGGRHRPPRHRGLHRLEGEGGAEGRRPRHRLQDLPAAAQGHHEGCVNCEAEGEACFDPAKNPALKRAIKEARRDLVPDNYARRIIQFARQGYKEIEFAAYDTDWDSEAYLTVSGQNSNNSVRVTDEFLTAVEEDRDWALTARLGGRTVKTLKARDLWEKIGHAAWASADPGIQFHTTINDWHTCPKSGPIRRRTRARSTCSSTTRPATWRRST